MQANSAEVDNLNISLDDIENQIRQFEALEKEKLGLTEEKIQHWQDNNPVVFTKEQRAHTTLLLGGLTIMQDRFLEAGLSFLGYRVKSLDVPDVDAMQLGKEYGNRGQCNPTYFTVGNLVKHLMHLRDNEGMSTEDIIKNHAFVTAGACGPCRFGTYVTEYRKALRDAGFDGFRLFTFQVKGGLSQGGDQSGLSLTPKFFITVIKCVMAGDIINLMGYRIRPYEVEEGSTDRALNECSRIICEALSAGKSVLKAMFRARKILKSVEVNRLQAKPKVSIIGEFWAMTTEGDGNYRLQRFLESEGAECDIQPVTNWLLYTLWQVKHDTQRDMYLSRRENDHNNKQAEKPMKKIFMSKLASFALKKTFNNYARAIGLNGYKLGDMDKLAEQSHDYYQTHLRGGEGHMEVGKLIGSVSGNKSHMVISVKPFGCMPSSGVSDGVQSLITTKFPEANFLPIETSGDCAVNAYSRIQMALFKARKKAQKEFDSALDKAGVSCSEEIKPKKKLKNALYYPKHVVASTAANAIYESVA